MNNKQEVNKLGVRIYRDYKNSLYFDDQDCISLVDHNYKVRFINNSWYGIKLYKSSIL
jgi:hypothetical protein